MDSGILAAFIIAGFAVITSVINILTSRVNAKKNSNISFIVDTRINYMQKLRNANAIFIGIANPNVILNCIKNNSLTLLKDFVESAGILKTLLKPFYPIEKRMIDLINSIENNSIKMFNDGIDNNIFEKNNIDLTLYIKLFNQYDWSYWQFIMSQADGQYKNSNNDFDKLYKELGIKYKKDYNYDWIEN